jgi:signal transduction histidine kinase
MVYFLIVLFSLLAFYPLSYIHFNKLYKRKILKATEEAVTAERVRISSELHDSTIQRLQAVRMRLDRILLYSLREEIVNDLTFAKRDLVNEIAAIRHLIHDELAPQLVQEAFSRALGDFCRSIDGLLQWKLVFENKNPEMEFYVDELSKLELYRICQQVIQNTFSHGLGDEISVVLKWGDELYINIEDNGHGFIGKNRGLGIPSIQTRAEKIGAKLKIHSRFNGVKTTIQLAKKLKK